MDMPWFGILGRMMVAYGIYKTIKLITSFFSLYILPRVGIRTNPMKYGSWAVVTGSTDGIGKCYAKELAKAGLNLVLVSRSKDKLEDTKKDIESVAKVDIKTVVFDFSEVDGYDKIDSELKGLDIGILVNNVGASYSFPQFTNEIDSKEMERLVMINCMSAMKMTKLVLDGMLERKRGAIVNVTSYSSFIPFPFLNVYAACKIFVDYFTKALPYEYPRSGIDFQVLCPMYVSTKMSGMRPSLSSPTSETYARSALGTLGLTSFTHGYWFHDVISLLGAITPTWISSSVVCKNMMAMRKKALRKREKKK